jgi:Xaa-Pro aminopeptidase
MTTDEQIEFDRRIAAARELMREHGLDAIIATDDHSIHGLSPTASKRQPPYARYFSNFHIPSELHPHGTTAIVPLSGESVLLVPPGIRRSYVQLARNRSWISNVVDLYVDDPAWEVKTRWGWMATDIVPGAVAALRSLGLERGRIGVAGLWSEFEPFEEALPIADFVPTLASSEDGGLVDLLEPLVASNSPWEMAQLETAHRAGDAMTSAFIDAALAGGSAREARADAQAAGIKAGADDMIMFGSIGVTPWTYWDWSLPVDGEFQRDRLYFFQVAISATKGYEVQSARSFVVGTPSQAHRRIHDTMEATLEAIRARITPESTGGDLFLVGSGVVLESGLALWGQLGHGMGYKAHSAPRGVALVPGQPATLVPGQALVLHACVIDEARGEAGMLGDTMLVDADGGVRFAATEPLAPVLRTTA